MWWETERSKSKVLVNDQKPEMKLQRDYVRDYNSCPDEMHNLNTKMTAERSPSKMLNINKTNKSTLQAKHPALELDLGAEAGQEEGGTWGQMNTELCKGKSES